MADNVLATDKRCPRCEVRKPLGEFYISRGAPDGRQGTCKRCQRDYHASEAGKTRQRNGHYLREFGLTLDAYESMLAGQAGACALCRRPPGTRRLHVDHDHATGQVRGLLCQSCNRALGYLGDDPAMLLAAFAYLTAGESHR